MLRVLKRSLIPAFPLLAAVPLPLTPFCLYLTAAAMFKFASKRDLRSDLRCSIRLLNENEVLESVEFAVRGQ